MDTRKTKWTALARIPDLNAVGPDIEVDGERGIERPASSGRLINQALSFKLLAGVALLLLVGAIIPFSISKKNPPAEPSSTAAAPLTAWRPSPPAASAGTISAPARNSEGTQTPAYRPAALIPATPERSPAPVVLPPRPEVKSEPSPSRTDDLPRMSSWPNPAHANSRQTDIRNRYDRTGSSVH